MTKTTASRGSGPDSVSLDLKDLQPTSIFDVRSDKMLNATLLLAAFVSLLLPFSGRCLSDSTSTASPAALSDILLGCAELFVAYSILVLLLTMTYAAMSFTRCILLSYPRHITHTHLP